jgi:hypothetical protein
MLVSTALKVLGLGAVVFATFLATQTLFRPKTQKEIQADLERDVANLKKTLPQEVHPLVTWFDVEAGRQTIIYKYKIKAPRSVIMNKREEMERDLKGSVAVAAAKFMLPRGVKMRCDLFDQRGTFLFGIDCD